MRLGAPPGVRRVASRGRAAFVRLAPWQQGLLLLGVGIVGLLLLLLLRPEPPLEEPPSRVPLVSVVPAEVRHGHLRVRGNGTVRPTAEVALAPEVAGRVEWVSPSLVSGGRFRAGEVLLRIDPADYQNAVAVARAEVAQRRVEVLQAQEEVAVAREEYRRLQAREGVPAPPEAGELGSLVFREPQLQAARAALRRAEARLEDALLALQRTRLRAPFDGIVRSESVDVGQYVLPGQAVARVYSTESAEILVPLADEDAALVPGVWEARPGAGSPRIPATVYVEYGGVRYAWQGYVHRAEAALDEETRTVNVVVRVSRPFEVESRKAGQGASGAGREAVGTAAGAGGAEDRPADAAAPAAAGLPGRVPERPPLLLGAYTTVEIQGVELERYVVVPRSALRDGDVVWTVRVAGADTLLVMEPAVPIQEVEDEVCLEADLADGTPVVVSDLPVVTDSMRVRVARPAERLETGGEDGPGRPGEGR